MCRAQGGRVIDLRRCPVLVDACLLCLGAGLGVVFGFSTGNRCIKYRNMSSGLGLSRCLGPGECLHSICHNPENPNPPKNQILKTLKPSYAPITSSDAAPLAPWAPRLFSPKLHHRVAFRWRSKQSQKMQGCQCKTGGISGILGGLPTILLNILNNYNRRKPPPKNSTACVIAAAHKAMQLGLPLLGIDADEATKEQHAEYAASLGKQPLRDYLAGIEEELDGDTQASLEAWRAAASDVLAGSKRVPDDALTAIKDAVVRDCAGPGRGRGEHPAGESAPLMSMIGGGEAARKREVEMWRNLATLVQGTCMGRPCRTVLVVAGRDNVDSMVNSLLRDRGVGGNVPEESSRDSH